MIGLLYTTLLITLLESANISLQIDTADQSSVVELAEDTGIGSTIEPTSPTQMTTPSVVETFIRSLSTQGSSVVRAFASTRSPANYTLVIYTRNPNQTANVSLETSPANVAYDVKFVMSDDSEALMVTFKTSEEVNTTLLITLLESANISLQIDTADQSSVVELAEDTGIGSTIEPTSPTQMTTPSVGETFIRSLSTQGSSVVRAFASTRSPANYTLVIYTRNPNQTANVSLETSPADLAYDVKFFMSDDPEALMVTFKTSEEVNTTLLITLLESANISLQIDTADQSSVVELAEDTGIGSTIEPTSPTQMTTPSVVETFIRSLSTQGSNVVRAFASTRSPANYTLVIYTRNPNQTANVSLETAPANVAYDVRLMIINDPDRLVMTFSSSETVNTSVYISLQESANITFQVESSDPYSVIELLDVFIESTTVAPSSSTQITSTGPVVMHTFQNTLFAMGDKIVLASVSTQGVAMYTLVVYTLNANIDVQTVPDGLAVDVMTQESSGTLITTFETGEPSTSKMFVYLMGPSVVTLEVHTTDPTSVITLAEVNDIVPTDRPDHNMTQSPGVVQSFIAELNIVASAVVHGLVSTRNPANYTLIVYTQNPGETVNLTVETVPADLAYGVSVFLKEDEEAVAMVFKTLEVVNTTIVISLMGSANITLQVETIDQFSVVSLVEVTDVGTTIQPTMMSSSTQEPDSVATLSTSGNALIEAYASTSGPANFTLVVYTKNPRESVTVDIETQPANLTSDVRYLNKDDEQALAVLFIILEPANTSLSITITDAANITLRIESNSNFDIRLEEVELTSGGGLTTEGYSSLSMTGQPSTSGPGDIQQVSRNISTSGPANLTFGFELVEPATIYITLNASSEFTLLSEPVNSVDLDSTVEHVLSRYILTTRIPVNITLILSADDAAWIETTVVSVNANDVDIVIETTLHPTGEPVEMTSTTHMFGKSDYQ